MASVESNEARSFSDFAALRRHLKEVAANAIANAKRR
jgi:hypothetical protein